MKYAIEITIPKELAEKPRSLTRCLQYLGYEEIMRFEDMGFDFIEFTIYFLGQNCGHMKITKEK